MSIKESQSYKQMLDEVEAITREVAQPEIDLDHLVERVERGYTLIESMRARLDQTKTKIEELHEKFETVPAAPAGKDVGG